MTYYRVDAPVETTVPSEVQRFKAAWHSMRRGLAVTLRIKGDDEAKNI